MVFVCLFISEKSQKVMGFPGGSDSKESSCRAGEPGSIPGLGRSPGEGNGYLLLGEELMLLNCGLGEDSNSLSLHLENSMDRGA